MAETALRTAGSEVFPLAFRFEDARFGTCVGVHLPAGGPVAAASLLAALHPEERELCRSMRGARLVELSAGALPRAAPVPAMGCACAPTLIGANGAPDAGAVRISLSHTQNLAVALASPDLGYALGVDIETIAADRQGNGLLAERILSPEEGADIDIVQRLSIKEAAYKAVFALTGTHLPLRDIVVARVAMDFSSGVPKAEVEAISSRMKAIISASPGRGRRPSSSTGSR